MRKNEQNNWTKFHIEKATGNYPMWPVEVMVKCLFGNYLKNKIIINQRMKVLDVGCGFGNNLMPFLIKGCSCCGVEISNEICDLTRKILNERGFTCDVQSGCNTDIPFDDNFFNLIISNNVIHYEKSEKDIHSALKEYARVLKPEGSLFLMTVGPNHTIYKKAKIVGHHQYLIQNYDFRDGEQYFYFDNLNYLEYYISQYFEIVETGRVQENLMTTDLDFLICVAQRKKIII